MKHLGWIGLLTLSLIMLASEVFACPERMSDLSYNGCAEVPAGIAYSSSALLGINNVKDGAGTVEFCTILGGAVGNITMYDGKAPLLATNIMVATFPFIATSALPFHIPLDAAFARGFSLVTSANTIWRCAYR